jgi:hypothetical protein
MNPIDEWWSFLHTKSFDLDWEELGLDDQDLARYNACWSPTPKR